MLFTPAIVATALVSPPGNLMAWLRQEGGFGVVKIATDSTTGLRGLVATEPKQIHQRLLSVPIGVCLSDYHSCSDGMGSVAPEWTSNLPSKVQLTMLVMAMRNQAAQPSDWNEYFTSSWPETVAELPSNLDLATLKAAYDSTDPAKEIAASVGMSLAWMQDQFTTAAGALREAQEKEEKEEEHAQDWDALLSDFANFRNVLSLVASRCLRISAGERGERLILAPILDMANHECTPSAYYYYNDDDASAPALELRAAQPIAAGDAVTICYGTMPNELFVQSYGFMPTPNPHDAVYVALPQLLDAAAAFDGGSDDGVALAALRDKSVSDRAAIAGLVGIAGLPVERLALHAAAPSEATILSLRGVLNSLAQEVAGGGDVADEVDLGMLAAMLEGSESSMDLWDDYDEEEDDYGYFMGAHDGDGAAIAADPLDETMAECARIVAAACAHLVGIYDAREAERASHSASPETPADELLCAFRRSQVQLLRSLTLSMEEVASEACAGRRVQEMADRRRTPPVFPYVGAIMQ